MSSDNPFEELDLDPAMSPEELTEKLRRRVERVSEDERPRLQKAWRALTLKDSDRVRLALLTHPRPNPGRDPLTSLREAVPPVISRATPAPLTPTVADAAIDEWETAHTPAPPNPWRERKTTDGT